MTLRIGSLFSGYGGLELGIQQVLGGEVIWHSEIDPNASKILDHHWPNTPNLGDITQISWADVPPVDVLTGGFPCQPVSAAGRRAGITDERWLFDDILTAIRLLDPQPRLCVFENVRGLLTANRGDAMARVVEGLASVGYMGTYGILPASAVGAPHRRERVFIVAYPADPDRDVLRELAGGALVEETRPDSCHRSADPGGGSRPVTVLPTPTARDHKGHNQRRDATSLTGALLPTPRASRGASATETVNLLPTPVADNSRGLPSPTTTYQSLANTAAALLPTPRATEGTHGGPNQRGSKGDLTMSSVVHTNFGEYAPAIEQWERILGRPAPPPTEPGTGDRPRLSPAFVEFMMGLPQGHVTDVGISRVAQLTALGNGVVPQQAAAAIRALLERTTR